MTALPQTDGDGGSSFTGADAAAPPEVPAACAKAERAVAAVPEKDAANSPASAAQFVAGTKQITFLDTIKFSV
jgi:hypothetical protein